MAKSDLLLEERLKELKEQYGEDLKAINFSMILALLMEWGPKILALLKVVFPAKPGPFANTPNGT